MIFKLFSLFRSFLLFLFAYLKRVAPLFLRVEDNNREAEMAPPDPYECPVCELTYNGESRRPLVLPCTHSFCQRCLQGVKASTNPVCPLCRHDLSRNNISDFLFCHQLVPSEEELEMKKKTAMAKKNNKPKNICKQHEGLEYMFWCQFCNCPACKKCLHRMHKNCDWVILEERVGNLEQEFDESLKFYAERVREMHDAGFGNRRQLDSVKKAIRNLNSLKDQLEDYYELLASVHGEAEDCLQELVKGQRDAASGDVDPLSLLQRKVSVTGKLQELLTMPEQPTLPLLQLLENYEASVNMALQPESKRQRLQFSKTLAGFRYHFKDGRLKHIDTGEDFKFVVQENNQAFNQAHYEALGEVMNEHVYDLLTRECGLNRLPVPMEGNGNQPSSFIFASPDWKTCTRLMILIHGSGVVRAGQWARRLIINDSLNSGTQLPYIHRAKSEGYGVLVLNTNHNRAEDETGRTWPIRGSEDPTRHADTVWRQYVLQSSAQHIAIVAHSYGGCVATHLFTQFNKDFNHRVFAVALTDSVHMITNPGKFHSFMQRSRNWVTSNTPLDTNLSHNRPKDVPTVSAGVTAHEMTSWGGFNSVFEYFSIRYHDQTNKRIPKVREEVYLSYPPSPAVRQEPQVDKAMSLPSSGEASLSSAAGGGGGATGQPTRDLSLPSRSQGSSYAAESGAAAGHRDLESSRLSNQGAVGEGGGDQQDEHRQGENSEEDDDNSGDERRRRRHREEGRKGRKERDDRHRKDERKEDNDDGTDEDDEDDDRHRRRHDEKREDKKSRDHDGEHKHRSSRRNSEDQNHGDHHHHRRHRSDKNREVEKEQRRNGREEGSDSTERRHRHDKCKDDEDGNRRHDKKQGDGESRRSRKHNRHDGNRDAGSDRTEDSNAADSSHGKRKKERREVKKGSSTGKDSSTEGEGFQDEQEGEAGDGDRRHHHRRSERIEKQRSRDASGEGRPERTAQDESEVDAGGSEAESGDEGSAGEDGSASGGKSGDEDQAGDEKSGDEGSGDENGVAGGDKAGDGEKSTDKPGAEGAAARDIPALQNGSAGEHEQTAGKEKVSDGSATKDGRVKSNNKPHKRPAPAEGSASGHRGDSDESDLGDKDLISLE